MVFGIGVELGFEVGEVVDGVVGDYLGYGLFFFWWVD